MPTHDWFAPTRRWALDLTAHFSQTDTPGEAAFPAHLLAALARWPYFQRHPEYLAAPATLDDPRPRQLAVALVRGVGPETLILTGHYDVVSIANYGPLADVACDPEALLPRLIAQLEAEGPRSPADALALADLRAGDFLPGRGLLDMKGGLAAGLAVLERFAALPAARRRGSLLFVAVPDEEVASHGARSLAARLPELEAAWGLEVIGALNLDSSDDPGDGTQGRAAYLGSVGKLLPAFLIVGREAHAGSPYAGVNPLLLAAELIARLEARPELADSFAGETTAPPVCLHLSDSKTGYDVTTPQRAWLYFNWLTLRRTPAEVLAAARAAAAAALQTVLTRLATASEGRAPAWEGRVLSFAELRAAAQARRPDFAAAYAAYEASQAADPALDAPTLTRRLLEFTWEAAELTGPAVVLALGALTYPPILAAPADPGAARLEAAIRRAAAVTSAAAGESLMVRPFFPGISDVSFLSARLTPAELDDLAAAAPAWGSRTRFAVPRPIPAANIGPWGRDYHQRLERLHLPYACQTLPAWLWQIAAELELT